MDKHYRSKKSLWIFRGIVAFSAICLLLAIDVRAGLEQIHPFLGEMADVLLAVPSWLLSPLYGLLLWAGRLLDPLVDGDTRSTVFSVLGLAASIIPPVYEAEATRRHGILVKEMIGCYFPCYKFVLLVNFVLSIAGQHIAQKDKWVYLFMAISVTAVYSVFLLRVSGFDEEKSDQYMQNFIRTKGDCLFRPTVKAAAREREAEHRIAQIDFIADISAFLAQKIDQTKTSYWQTDPNLKSKIRSAVDLILRHSKITIHWYEPGERPLPKTEKAPEKPEKRKNDYFQDDFKSFFDLSDDRLNDFSIALYYQIPKCLGPQNVFADRVELAGVFWKNLLAPAGNMRAKADVVCRVYDAIGLDISSPPMECGCLILGCGLISYLYQESRMLEDGSAVTGSADHCARFVEEMHNIYLTDKPTPTPDLGSLKADERRDMLECICRDHMLLVWCISEIEQYLLARQATVCEAARIIHGYARRISSGIIMGSLYDNNIIFFLSLAMSLIQRIPSPANRKLTLLHKRRLMSYVLSRKETIGAWNDVSN